MKRRWNALIVSLVLAVASPLATNAWALETHGWEQVGKHRIFYREAGPRDAPVVVLLHGFPSSSFMYRSLIPRLATRYRVIAPDYPGAGHSDAPPVAEFPYTFDAIGEVMRAFLAARGAERYSLYMQDFGGPVGFRIAEADPARIDALIVQNANIYEAGLSEGMQAVRPFWGARTHEATKLLSGFISPESIKDQIVAGAERPSAIHPDAWTHAQALLAIPARRNAQLEMLHDYGSNLRRYAGWQAYLRSRRPATLVVWGKNDPYFVAAGATSFAAELPEARIRLLNAGHFALEEKGEEIATEVLAFLKANVVRKNSSDHP